MTREEATSVLRILRSTFEKDFEYYRSRSINGAALIQRDGMDALQMAIDALSCKPENRPNDERSTDKGMFIPESPKDAEMDVFKTNVDKSLNELNKGIMQLEREIHLLWKDDFKASVGEKLEGCDKRLAQLETEIEMLWSEVEYLKGKTK